MLYSTDCKYIVKCVGKDTHFECYNKEQVKNCIRQSNGTLVYKVKSDGKLELMTRIKPEV